LNSEESEDNEFVDFDLILEQVKYECWLMYEERQLDLNENYKIILKRP